MSKGKLLIERLGGIIRERTSAASEIAAADEKYRALLRNTCRAGIFYKSRSWYGGVNHVASSGSALIRRMVKSRSR